MKTARAQYMPSLLAYLLMLFLGIVSWKAANAQIVVLKGTIISPEEIISRPTVTLVQPDGQRVPLHVRANGQFRHELPPDRVALLLVGKPGCVDKVVRVDTRYADRAAGGSDRTVVFEVHLHAADGSMDERYADAVGNITFHHSNGRMKVGHDYTQCGDNSVACIALE